MKTVRFGVSLPQDLIERFDQKIKHKSYSNRSEAIRDLIRKYLIGQEIGTNKQAVGILHLLFDHHKRELSDKLTAIQHDHHEMIISTTHVHLDHYNCLEVILLKGNALKIKDLADKMVATKGVIDGELYLTTSPLKK